jgi:alcohol dehydrogenase class IV
MTSGAHGALCARLLPVVLRTNWDALCERAPDHQARARLDDLGALLTDGRSSGVAAAIAWISELLEELSVPRLGAHGVVPAMIPALVQKAQRASSMQGNPIPLRDDEVGAIVEACL